MNDQPTWQFPPRGIGVEIFQDPASAHFRDDPIRKLVREVLQNSLDAKEEGLDDPVEVKFTEAYIDADLIGGAELKGHCGTGRRASRRRPGQSFGGADAVPDCRRGAAGWGGNRVIGIGNCPNPQDFGLAECSGNNYNANTLAAQCRRAMPGWVTMPEVNPEILIWARETAGLTPGEAAWKLGFRDSGVSSATEKLAVLEAGHKAPSRAQLVKMADQYRRPLLAFYLPQPPRKGDRGADFRTLSPDISARDEALLDALVRDVRARQSMVRAVLEEDDEVAPLTFIGSHRIEAGRDMALVKLRELLQVSAAQYRAQANATAAFNLLRNSAENAGIFVLLKGDVGNYRTSLDTSFFRGFSIADDLAPFIVINDQDAHTAWSFTLLHELVHLLLGQTGVSAARAENAIERFCDGVAGDFLLPPAELRLLQLKTRDDFGAVDAGIREFANARRISRRMVAYQAAGAGFISREMCEQLVALYRQQWRDNRAKARESARERESGPSFYVVRRQRLGHRILSWVRMMLADNALSTAEAAQILGVKSRQVHSLLDIPSGR